MALPEYAQSWNSGLADYASSISNYNAPSYALPSSLVDYRYTAEPDYTPTYRPPYINPLVSTPSVNPASSISQSSPSAGAAWDPFAQSDIAAFRADAVERGTSAYTPTTIALPWGSTKSSFESAFSLLGLGGSERETPALVAVKKNFDTQARQLVAAGDAEYNPGDSTVTVFSKQGEDAVQANIAAAGDLYTKSAAMRTLFAADEAEKQQQSIPMTGYEKAQLWLLLGMIGLQFYAKKTDREYAEELYEKQRLDARDDAQWERDRAREDATWEQEQMRSQAIWQRDVLGVPATPGGGSGVRSGARML